MGRVERIWIKRGSGAPMDEVSNAQLVAGRGIVGNANQGGKRQVTLLSSEMWNDVTGELMLPDPSVRRANLLVSSVDLRESRGKTLRIGNVRIRINGETRPCYEMDEAVPGLRKAMSVPWGGGAFGEVLDDGAIAIGDRAEWEQSG
jgi:MOSC domain-containing protein YiiM